MTIAQELQAPRPIVAGHDPIGHSRCALPCGRPARFLGRRGGKVHVIPQAQVILFASEGGLTRLCTAESHYWIERTLGQLEARLDPAVFHRISRAAIVNIDAILQVACMPGGSGEVTLGPGARHGVSRRRLAGLLRAIEGDLSGGKSTSCLRLDELSTGSAGFPCS